MCRVNTFFFRFIACCFLYKATDLSVLLVHHNVDKESNQDTYSCLWQLTEGSMCSPLYWGEKGKFDCGQVVEGRTALAGSNIECIVGLAGRTNQILLRNLLAAAGCS
jgi:hypothetical protein